MPSKSRPRALRYLGGRVQRVVSRVGTAAEAIGPLEPGIRITGVTAGQFSAIDAMEHMVAELGPGCEVRISTWTTGIYDVERAAQINADGGIARVRMLLDRATFEKSPQFAGPLIERLGVDAFRCLSVHAKVTLVRGPRGAAAWRSSMNLNKNLRTEQFDIDVDEAVAAFYEEWFDRLWEESGERQDNAAIITAVYGRFQGADRTDARPARKARPARRKEDIKFSVSELLRGIVD